MEVDELLKHVHSVMGEVVYFDKEAADYLARMGVKYREWGMLVKVSISELEEKGIPRSELEKYKVKTLETNRKLIDASKHLGSQTESINNLLINREQKERMLSRKSSRKLIDSVVILNTILKSIDDSHIKQLVDAAKMLPRRKTTSLYIDEKLWNEFLHELISWGIPQKKAHIVIEGLIAKFIEGSRKLRLQNEGKAPLSK